MSEAISKYYTKFYIGMLIIRWKYYALNIDLFAQLSSNSKSFVEIHNSKLDILIFIYFYFFINVVKFDFYFKIVSITKKNIDITVFILKKIYNWYICFKILKLKTL